MYAVHKYGLTLTRRVIVFIDCF